MGACVIIMKIVAAAGLFLAFVLGVSGHASSDWTKSWNNESTHLKENCEKSNEALDKATADAKKLNDKNDIDTSCPSYAIPLEIVFITFTIILFIVSIVMLIMGCVMGQQQIKGCDGAYCIIAGILIIVCGIMMIISAAKIDRFKNGGYPTAEKYVEANKKQFGEEGEKIAKKQVEKQREDAQFALKIVAGVVALFDGIFYMVVCCIICASSD